MDTGPKQKRLVNPRYKANLFSILTFGWTIETFKRGYSRDILDGDLYAPLPEHRSDLLGDALQKEWEREVEKGRNRRNYKPSLWTVLFRAFGPEFMLYGLILAAMEFVFRLQQPFFLGLLLRYYSPIQEIKNETVTYVDRLLQYYEPTGNITWNEALFFAFGLVFCSAINVMVAHPFMMAVMHIGMKMRVGVCSLIYRKALKVNTQALSDSNAGLVVNLMANDVNRFDTGPLFVHYLWIGPLETFLMTVYLYREIGMAAPYGSLIICAVIPCQIFLGFRTAYYRGGTAEKSDERVRLMKEIIMGIEVIKMYTWEQPFRRIIDTARRNEVYYIRWGSYIRGIVMSFMMFTSRFGIFITILLYVIDTDHIDVETVFFITCYYNIMKQTMTLFFPQAVGQIAEMKVAVRRIRDYLLSEECEIPKRPPPQPITPRTAHKKVTIKIEPDIPSATNILADQSSSSNDQKNTRDLDLSDVIIKFTNATGGWVRAHPTDVRDINLNIVKGSLTTIIGSVGAGKSTLLHMILKELPCASGQLEVNGTISYASQEPWLFVGSVRQNILFGRPFVKSHYMEVCKVCALERDISLFPHGDKTIIGERGVSLSGGQRARINLARAIYMEADIYLLDDPLSAVDTHVAKHIFNGCIKRFLADKTVVLVTHQIQFIKSVDHIVIMENGMILADGDYQHLNDTGLEIINLLDSKMREVHEEELTLSAAQPSSMSIHRRHWSIVFDTSVIDQKVETEYQAIGRVQGTVYRDYFLAGAACPFAMFVLFLFILAQFCASGCDYWLSLWSNTEDQLTGDKILDSMIWSKVGISRKYFIIIFGCLTVATIAVALIRAFFFFALCMRSSIKLHDKMFGNISRSPMSFFHANPSGRILNRFSKDMGAVDEMLPQAMIDCFQVMLNLTGVVIVVIVADITLIIPTATIMLIFYMLRIIYIRTTGAVKRLEGITRSPVFGHLNATVLGLATIRSFGAEALLAQEFDRHQDLHSAAWYLFITCSRAFGYFLDLICLLFIICVTFSCLMKTEMDSSRVGLAITQSISLTGIFQWGMRQSAEMENQMTSVERVLEYTKLPKEPKLRCPPEKKPPKEWPQYGNIVFKNLQLRYTPDGNTVLHKLNLNILAKQKIGIVGRTGAGKSTVIQALFRMAYTSGEIIIDNIETGSIGLHDLREKISIIPQEPVLFSGTMRKNLDPFGEYADEVLITALRNVKLALPSDNTQDVLNKQITEGGSNFSVGERQLVCLARAIVRNNKILVLDEATANVDVQTDALIQTAIRVHFQNCTVLTIAHRLNTVIDSDKILVLDAGHLMEFDHPYVLLSNKKGYFAKMVAETGAAMAAGLKELAKENYEKQKQNEPDTSTDTDTEANNQD